MWAKSLNIPTDLSDVRQRGNNARVQLSPLMHVPRGSRGTITLGYNFLYESLASDIIQLQAVAAMPLSQGVPRLPTRATRGSPARAAGHTEHRHSEHRLAARAPNH